MNENQTLLTLIKSTQRANLVSNIGIVFGTLAGAITSGIMIWQSYKRKKPSVAVRIIRKKGEIAKTEERHKSEMTQKRLELETLEREMRHEAELKEFEVGLERKEEKELLSGADNLLNSLKNKGEGLINKGKEELEKGKNFTDQFKGLKDKFLDPKKD